MSRVDFFIEHGTNRIILNEINTIPGFTDISMYPMMMEASGIGFGELIGKLLVFALEKRSINHKI
jgi:D-alanine-D-alanine ligase